MRSQRASFPTQSSSYIYIWWFDTGRLIMGTCRCQSQYQCQCKSMQCTNNYNYITCMDKLGSMCSVHGTIQAKRPRSFPMTVWMARMMFFWVFVHTSNSAFFPSTSTRNTRRSAGGITTGILPTVLDVPKGHDHARSKRFSSLSLSSSALPSLIHLPESAATATTVAAADAAAAASSDAFTHDWLLHVVVWTDFRLAVAFFVVAPLVLLVWSAVEQYTFLQSPLKKGGSRSRDTATATTTSSSSSGNGGSDAILRVIAGYWQASSLLLITVLLNLEASPIGVITGTVAQAMIFISLQWWSTLNHEVETIARMQNTENVQQQQQQQQKILSLEQVFCWWRSITSWVAVVGVALQLPFLSCAFFPPTIHLGDIPSCAAWLEPPNVAASWIGMSSPGSNNLLHGVAMVALTIYSGYLLYYIAILLPSIGRDGRRVRPSFTLIDPLVLLGFLEENNEI